MLAVAAVLLLGLALTAVASPGVARADGSPPGPPLDVPEAKLAAALSCPVGFTHPEHRAVLLVHGTSVTVDENWGWNYAKALPKAGFDFCTVAMPDYAFVDIQISAQYVVYAIREVARRSNGRITTVGLSQGGIEPRWALKWWPDIHTLVASFVDMATPNHGALFGNGACVSSCVPAVWQEEVGAHLIGALNRDTETPYIGSVAYTSVYSQTDDIIQPAAPSPTAALQGAADIAVQDICPGRYVGHIQSAWDAAYYAVVIDALSHSGPADPARVDRSYCNQQAMPEVDPVVGWQMTAQLYATAGSRQAVYPDKPTSEPPLRCYATVEGCSGPAATVPDARWSGLLLLVGVMAVALEGKRRHRRLSGGRR